MIRINLTIATILKIIHILIKQTKKVIGKLKDETSSMAITHDQFVRLRLKMYSHKKGNDKSERKAIGMKKKSHKDVKHEGLKNVSFNNKRVHRK